MCYFLFQELVSDSLIGHTQPVFQFLCPLEKLLNEEEHYEGVWGLLSGLAYFLSPTQEEEEVMFHGCLDAFPSSVLFCAFADSFIKSEIANNTVLHLHSGL